MLMVVVVVRDWRRFHCFRKYIIQSGTGWVNIIIRVLIISLYHYIGIISIMQVQCCPEREPSFRLETLLTISGRRCIPIVVIPPVLNWWLSRTIPGTRMRWMVHLLVVSTVVWR